MSQPVTGHAQFAELRDTRAMADLGQFSDTRRRCLRAAVAGVASMLASRLADANAPAIAGARITADFEPAAAIWLGYDAGHETFTADLAEALLPHVPIKMLVRDPTAEAQARALLQRRRIDPEPIQFMHDERAPYFVRDAAVFGLDGGGQPFIVDFKWTYYGWTNWCRRTFRGNSRRTEECGRTDGPEPGNLDQWLADRLGMPSFRSSLAAEGGGVEVNGQGMLIANTSLWRSRNPGLTQAVIEAELLRLPGIRKVIWLPQGLAHDPLHRGTITGPYVGWGTGGHTDEFVRFADTRTVLLAWVDEADARKHPVARLNRARMRANLDILKSSTDQNGQPLRVIKVPLPVTMERPVVLTPHADTGFSEQWTAASFPDRERRRNGETVLQVATSSYLNYVVANKVLLLPDYVPHGTPPARQAQVQQIFESAFPGRRVQFIDAGSTNWFGGGAHCATLNQPMSRV